MNRRKLLFGLLALPLFQWPFAASLADDADVNLPMTRDLLMPGVHTAARTYENITWWDIGVTNDKKSLVVAFGDKYKNTVFGTIYENDIRSEEYKSMFWPMIRSMCSELLAKTIHTDRALDDNS